MRSLPPFPVAPTPPLHLALPLHPRTSSLSSPSSISLHSLPPPPPLSSPLLPVPLLLAPPPRRPAAQFDAFSSPTLFRRFALFAIPSIVHVHGGETRDMDALAFSASSLVRFAESGWRHAEPRITCASPSSTCGRTVGRAITAPLHLHAKLKHLHEDLDCSPTALLLGSLLVPVAVGVALVALADLYYCRGPVVKRRPTPVRASS